MTHIFRVSVNKLCPSELIGLCKVTSKCNNVAKVQVAFISRKIDRMDRPPRPAPFPYKEKTYNVFRSIFDPMLSRFDDNTKVIAIEGSIAVGKTELAKIIAEEYEMQYIPPITFEEYYKNCYGVDTRVLNSKFKPSMQFMDYELFCKNPHHINAAAFQISCLHAKFVHYMQALVHLLSTGQGIVIERTPYSDFVFILAMIRAGYIRKEVYPYYKKLYTYVENHLMKPHVVIYLDAPTNVIQKKIKERGIPHEVNSKAFTEEFLTAIEEEYKQKFLKTISEHSHVLTYDWTQNHDPEIIFHDIQKLSFEFLGCTPELYDWNLNEAEFVNKRSLYSLNTFQLERGLLFHEYCDIPELRHEAEDNLETYESIYALQEKQEREKLEKELRGKGFLGRLKTYLYPSYS